MIPKTLHYCWFGKGEKPKSFAACLKSWKKQCPDFEIIEWNETNSSPYQNKFVKQALRKKKYAFAADAVRVQALAKMGGIYLDTDMLLLKPIDETLLKYSFFTGYEVDNRPAYGFFGCVPNHPLMQKMANFYNQSHFDSFSPPVITHKFKNLITEDNLKPDEKIFGKEYFYPLSYENRNEGFKKYVTPNTRAVHLWGHSWSHKKEENTGALLKNLSMVAKDFVMYGYPYSYFKRYFREFSRKLYHKLKGKPQK